MKVVEYTKLLAFTAFVCLVLQTVANGQLNIIHQEGFNDDGDGKRYTMSGRGAEPNGGDGPGAWEHNFLVDKIGFSSIAPEKRAAILWTDNATEDDFTEDSLAIWDNLIGYMLEDKEAATIGFLPNATSVTGEFLSFRLEDAGHNIIDIDADLPDPGDVDLIIQTATGVAGFADPPYAVPIITYNGGQTRRHADLERWNSNDWGPDFRHASGSQQGPSRSQRNHG